MARVESRDHVQVLHDVTFAAEPGEMVALVGPSGAGKTTITHLVARLYDVDSGAVRVGGHDVRDVTLQSLEDVVGYVTQDAHMFHDTIRANLLYANPGASDREVWAALEAAQIATLVRALPDGLDTVVGDRGYRLSGGERQRLAIARLLLKAPAIVVLDEATAHLDSESEAAVQRALDAALEGRTSLVIAHRLSTVRNADLILVVDGGRIVQSGTHAQLLRAGRALRRPLPHPVRRRRTRPRLVGVDLQLADRVYVVTGGARGLGRATADVLVAEGARVVLSGRSQEALDAAVAAARGPGVVAVAADNADPATPGRLIAAAEEAWGRLDGALISVGGPPTGAVTDVTDEQWTAAFESVFLGAVRVAREVAAQLEAGGSIAFVLSSSVRSPLPNLAVSNGLRPGLAMVAKTLADELGPRGIRVNGLLPGRVGTERRRRARRGHRGRRTAREQALATIPLGRYGEPEEFGRAAAFLLSPAASFVTRRDAPGRRRHAPGPLTR